MPSTPYHVGETVNVGYYGVKIIDVAEIENCEIKVELDCDSGIYRMIVPLGVAEVQRVIPAEGEPQLNDVWQDRDGNSWFAAQHWPDYDDAEDSKGINGDGWRLVLVPNRLGEQGSPKRPEEANQQYGPLRLVYREVSSEPGQVEPEPAGVRVIQVESGALVTYPEWNGGEPVKVLAVEGAGLEGRLVAVRYTFFGARDGEETAVVSADTLVTPYGGAE